MSRLVCATIHALKTGGFKTPCVISLVFLVLIASFIVFLNRYWSGTLQPRLYHTAQTQAVILAESQAYLLQQALHQTLENNDKRFLQDATQKILLVEDPAIGQNIVEGLALQVDYQTVQADQGSLDFTEGNTRCSSCFTASIPLFAPAGDLLGIVDFTLSDAYFQSLSTDMKSKLMAESSIAMALMIAVWLTMLVMFYRLNTAKRIIEDSDRAKTRFMANVTHELRTPLNAILGYTQLYKEDPSLMRTHRQGIETIDQSAAHLLLMINDILDFSRSDQDSLSLAPIETAFVPFLQIIGDMSQAQAKLKGIKFTGVFDKTLPPVVRTDEKRLRQILLNLISNAIKFTPEGEVTFKVALLDSSPHYADIRFGVVDTGIGINPADVSRIFLPFVQVDNDITRAEGSGLGLTISQRILKLMQSKLQVASTPSKGTTVWFDLRLDAPKGVAENRVEILARTPTPSGHAQAPSAEKLERMIDQALRHNILGLKEAIAELENEARYAMFVEEVREYLRNYRFKPLVEYLTEKLKAASTEGRQTDFG